MDQNYKERPLKLSLLLKCGEGPISTGMIAGLVLITGGTLLFIDNLGILPVNVTEAFWPLVLLVLGAVGYLRTCSTIVKVWAAASMLAGFILILNAFHVIRANGDIIWPLILIATGISMLIGRTRWRDFTEQLNAGANFGTSVKGSTMANQLQEVAIFSGVKRRVEAAAFEGGELTSIFGSIDLDMRWAAMPPQTRVAVIEANAVFGGIEIRIPETWRLSVQGQAVFGSYEDKTIPPRPDPGFDPPTLIIRGGSVFGAVVVKN